MEAAPLHAETILYSPEVNKFCVLNATAALMWQTLQKPATLDELASSLCAAYRVEPERALLDVKETIENLRSLGCVIDEAGP